MKTKLLLTGIVSVTLLLGACGIDESEKKVDSKKSESVEKKDNDKKETANKGESKKEDKSNEQNEQESTQEPNTQEQQSQEVAQQEQPQEPTEHEQKEANAEWNRQNVEGGTDAGMLDPSAQPNEYYSNDQLDPETGLPKDDAVPHKVGEGPTEEVQEEPSEWVKGQDEWMNASEAEREEIRKADAEKYGYEYDPSDYEEE